MELKEIKSVFLYPLTISGDHETVDIDCGEEYVAGNLKRVDAEAICSAVNHILRETSADKEHTPEARND